MAEPGISLRYLAASGLALGGLAYFDQWGPVSPPGPLRLGGGASRAPRPADPKKKAARKRQRKARATRRRCDHG